MKERKDRENEGNTNLDKDEDEILKLLRIHNNNELYFTILPKV